MYAPARPSSLLSPQPRRPLERRGGMRIGHVAHRLRTTRPPRRQTAATTPAPGPTGDFNNEQARRLPPEPGRVNEVYGHSADTLFALDPKTKAVTEVGKFSGCGPVIDIALDETLEPLRDELHVALHRRQEDRGLHGDRDGHVPQLALVRAEGHRRSERRGARRLRGRQTTSASTRRPAPSRSSARSAAGSSRAATSSRSRAARRT